ncbi:MAG: acyl CoA:acetate/3-ketoacid CoA transferase [Acidiferrobacterales bacterium]
MSLNKIIPPEDAVALIHDGDVLATSGYGGNGVPEQLLISLERRFLETGEPRSLTLVYAGGQGDSKEKGLNRLGHEGLLKRVIGGHYGLIPKIEKLAVDNKLEAYNFPEGAIVHLYRDIAAGKPGTLTKVGLGTFVDPRLGGGKVNDAAREDLVTVADLGGEESLFFKALPINVAFIRGTTADPDGNITTEKESLRLEDLALAMAARNSGGIVLCQVERVAESGSLDARRVRVPGIFVDAIVIAKSENHMQTYAAQYNPGLSGELRVPLETVARLPLDQRKVIARRAALELVPNSVVNLGIGLPEAISRVANEEKIQDLLTFIMDPGVIGGVPLGGYDFGAALNFNAVIDHPYQFDFIDGGGLDLAYLGFAECDRFGNINVSRFGGRVAGCGGFINISQNSKKVVFVGTFSSGGLATEIIDGKLSIVSEGEHKKFVKGVEQVTFSGARAAKKEKDVLYITERCVFRLVDGGMELTEYAPGIDLQQDILDQLPFRPIIDHPQPMESMIFDHSPMGLRDRMLDIRIEHRLSYDSETNTIFMNFAGMRVRNTEDLSRIKKAVDGILGPLGKRVYSIVNYDSFEADPDIIDQYMDLVRYVEKKYYIKVSRYSTSGFMRLKMGNELEKRKVSSHVYESGSEARRHLRDK